MDTTYKRHVRRVVEQIWHRGNLNYIADAFSPRFVGNVPRGHLQDLAMYRRHVTIARQAFPDIRFDIQEQIEEGDMVASRYTIRATHLGDFVGIEATGEPIVVEGLTIDRFGAGRITQSWSCWDVLGLLETIGAVRRTSGRLTEQSLERR